MCNSCFANRSAQVYRAQGFTLVELMVVVTIVGIFSALAVQAFAPSKSRHELQNIRAQVVGALRSARATAVMTGAAVSIVLRTDLPLGHRLEVFQWNDNNNWFFDGDAEIAALNQRVLLQSAPNRSGNVQLSNTFLSKPEVAGCNNGTAAETRLATFLPNGTLVDSAQNICTFRIYLNNALAGLASAIELRPSGQIAYADSF